jgi:hypothetical protein
MRGTGALSHPAFALSERLSLGKLAVLGGESRAANVISPVEEFMLKYVDLHRNNVCFITCSSLSAG